MNSLGTYSPTHFSPALREVREMLALPFRIIEKMGHFLTFCGFVLGSVPKTFLLYRWQIKKALVDLTWGSGRIIVNGGTLSVLAVLGIAVGGIIGLEAWNIVSLFDLGPVTGAVSSYGVTREIGPLAAALGFAVQAGCRITAEIGAMRIAEEIDALEAIGIRPIPFVVTTRVIAGLALIIPVYMLTLILGYEVCSLLLNFLMKQSEGTYDFYFLRYLVPMDVFLSLAKTAVFIVVVVIVHSYYGYYATGGAEGVGFASGRAIRASIVVVIIVDMVLSILFWGHDPGVRITG